MKIAIIVHSHTGNTLSVAEKIKTKLSQQTHQVVLEQVVASNNQEVELAKVNLINKPNLQDYDGYVFAGPVHGFSLSGVMRVYLAQIIDLSAKPVYFFLTMYFPFKWMGGNRSLLQFTKALSDKNAMIKGSHIIGWSNETKRNRLIDETVNLITF